MLELQPKDARGYFNLPQRPEGAGYYTYGTPPNGAGQYAHPKLLSLLFLVEHQWQGIDSRKIGFGNISLADGAPTVNIKVIEAEKTLTSDCFAKTKWKAL